MNFALDIHPRVTQEAERIHAYQEEERTGSGERFLNALDACFDSILMNPFGYQVRKGEFRYAYLHRLKYRVVFRVKGDRIFVVQVRHTSRKPSKRFGP
jgi:plasmid stabilization system protein ParE